MSLINKLLQDLEQRQAGTESSAPIATGVQSVYRPPRRGGWMVAAMLIVPLVAAAGLWVLMSKGPVPPATVAHAPAPAPTPAAATTPAPASVTAPAPATPPAPATAAAPTAPAAPTPAPAPQALAVAQAAASATPPVVAPAEAKPEAAKSAPAKVEIAKVEAPKVESPKAEAAKAADPASPKAVVPASPEKSKAVVAQATPKAEPKPEPKAQTKAEPKPVPDSKIAGMYPGVIKKPLNDPAAAAASSAEQPIAAAEKPAARVAAATEPQSQKTFTARQQSDNLYKQAVIHAQQGQGKDARDLLAKSLEAAPQNVPARQLLAGLLVEANKLPDALAVLREGVKVSPEQSAMWMNLARLQLEFGDANAATATLEQGLTPAGDDAPYNAFYAVLLQRAGRHDGALKHYLVALRSDPSMPNWLVGAGISMQALGRDSDAIEAFQRAKDGGQLPAAFISFVDQRLAQLKR